MNPVRANMVAHPAGHPWSSYRCNALGKYIKLVTPHVVYNAPGDTRKARQAAYRALFNSQLSRWSLEEIGRSLEQQDQVTLTPLIL
jgi:putative transposase